MKLAMFEHGGATRLGVVEGDEVADLSPPTAKLPTDVLGVLRGGDEALRAVRVAVKNAQRIPLTEVRLQAPIAAPRKFLGLGLSFKSHVEEVRRKGVPIPISPNQVWFNKQVTSINGPYDPIHIPRVSTQVDYEGEMAMVIGKRARYVKKENAREIIAGFMVCNDVSVRDWQLRAPTATLGKSFDTHGPTGPWLTTADEFQNPESARIRTWVDGELRQDGNTNDFIYSLAAMIEELSTVFTLEAGDILATGTPAGVGGLMDPPGFLRAGQVVRIEVDGLGRIENPVIQEPSM
jgi:2-keto-4-pentenoate hydratase/2-oxohepta-3-ene-1,7-dioic acid hydratase in catechol pathway